MERAILISTDYETDEDWTLDDVAAELRELATSGRAEVVDELVCKIDRPNPAHFIGKGKIEELRELIEETDAQVAIFNHDLTPVQQKNIEEITDAKTIDRTQLILDIFASRAHSGEGKVQVELAQLVYLLPRLTGKGILLSRLGGGIGTRGPGEMKLEVDRRRIGERITKLKKELEELKRQRYMRRKARQKFSAATIALVGYTNAGKSTLLNALTGADVIVQDQLFSTLDPTIRKTALPNNQKALFVDTVGFLHNLPHHLIESFKATLEEVIQADIMIHILDANHPKVYEHCKDVYKILEELGVQDKPIITALNKIDKIENESEIRRLTEYFPNSVPISALYKKGFEELLDKVMLLLSHLIEELEVTIPYNKMALLDLIYRTGKVIKRLDDSSGIFLQATVPLRVKHIVEEEIGRRKKSG